MVTRPIGALIVATLVTSALLVVPAAPPAVASRTVATEVNPSAKPLKGGNGPLTYSIALYTYICLDVIYAAADDQSHNVGVYITEMCGSPGNPGSGPQFGSAVMDAAKLYETYLTEIRNNVLGYFRAELAWYQTKGPAKTRKKVVPILTELHRRQRNRRNGFPHERLRRPAYRGGRKLYRKGLREFARRVCAARLEGDERNVGCHPRRYPHRASVSVREVEP